MSPTVLRHGPYRFFFFSREESRMHVHVNCREGEAKFWLEPDIELAYSRKQLREAEQVIFEHRLEIANAWRDHFGH